MNAYVPFICLAAGAAINWRGLPSRILKLFDAATDLALIVLMLVIGLNIGTSEKVMSNLGVIGFNCLVISLSAIAVSVLLVLLAEKTIMPLEEIRLKLAEEKGDDQFEISDGRSVDEVYQALVQNHLQPVMNDYVYV